MGQVQLIPIKSSHRFLNDVQKTPEKIVLKLSKYIIYFIHRCGQKYKVQYLPEQKADKCHEIYNCAINIGMRCTVFNDGWLPGSERHW